MAKPQIVHLRPKFKSPSDPELVKLIADFRAAKARMLSLREKFNEAEDAWFKSVPADQPLPEFINPLEAPHSEATFEWFTLGRQLMAHSPEGVAAVGEDVPEIITCLSDDQTEEMCLTLARHCYE